MKTVFNNRELAHKWAAQSQPPGRSGSMKFYGPRIYSYQTCIAMIHVLRPNGLAEWRVALLNSNRYSVTTSGKHMPAVRDAVSHMRTFTVPICDADTPSEHASNLHYLLAEYARHALTLRRMRRDPYTYDTLHGLAQRARLYAQCFALAIPDINDVKEEQLIRAFRYDREARLNTPENIAKRARVAADREAAKERKRLRDEAKRIEAQAEQLQEFRNGELIYGALTDERGGAYLRIVGDSVQTSRGASVPVSSALLVIALCLHTIEAKQAADFADMTIGGFSLHRIEADGTVTIGCHTIYWPEIERIAVALGV